MYNDNPKHARNFDYYTIHVMQLFHILCMLHLKNGCPTCYILMVLCATYKPCIIHVTTYAYHTIYITLFHTMYQQLSKIAKGTTLEGHK